MNEETPTHIGSVEDEASGYVGPYKLLQMLGEGGMGTVYMAEQEHPVRRRVALKVIKPGMDSRQVIARFEAERQAVAMMDHQNIAKVLDAGTTDDQRPYFVMELVQGIPITDYCDKNRLTLEDRLQLFIPVCHAIQHAHQKGIIHRDIKPSNILVTMYDGKPVPKVIDFGLAKALQQRLTERTMYTQFGQVVGTLEYMSPEQAEMNAIDVDTRSDIYSLGVLMYELLTGTTPLKKQTLREQAFDRVLQIIREDDPPKPSTRLSESGDAITGISSQRRLEPNKLSQLLRGDLDWIVMTALDKDRARRYQTATSFGEDVDRFLSNEPIQARPPSTLYRLRKLVRRNFAVVMTGTTFFGLLVASSVISVLLAIKAHDARALAETEEQAAKEATAAAQKATAAAKLLREEDLRLRRLAEMARDRAIEQKHLAESEAGIAASYADLIVSNLKTDSEKEADMLDPAGFLSYASRFLDDPDTRNMAQTAMNLTGSSAAPLAAGVSLASVAQSLVRLRETAGSLEELISTQRRRVEDEDSAANRTVLSSYLTLVASLYIRDGKFSEAAHSAAESIEIRAQDQPDDWRIFETRSILGEALTGLKQLEMAEVELQAGFEGLTKTKTNIPGSVRQRRLVDAAKRLVSLYSQKVDAVNLLNWQRKVDELSRN
ncbi:MAG: serine/threonine protein kinase [Planctomycetaceae bacterium]